MEISCIQSSLSRLAGKSYLMLTELPTMLNVFDATYEFTYSKSYSDTVHQETLIEGYTAISRNVVRKNVHATTRKVIWSMVNTLILTY